MANYSLEDLGVAPVDRSQYAAMIKRARARKALEHALLRAPTQAPTPAPTRVPVLSREQMNGMLQQLILQGRNPL